MDEAAKAQARAESLGALFENSPDGYCILEMLFDTTGRPRDYRWLEANPAFERHTGLSNVVGRTALELVPNLELHWVEIYGRVALTGEPDRFIQQSEVMQRWFEVDAFRVGAPALRRVGLLFRDVTKRHAAEEARRHSEERYRMIGRATNDVIWDWDLRSDLVEWNDAVGPLMGYAPAELGPTSAGWTSRIHPDDCPHVLATIHAAIDGGKESWVEEYRFRRRDGSYALFLDRGYIARDPLGTPLRMIGSMVDLSAQQRTELALREANAQLRSNDRQKDEFLAMLAHELRNPLAAIGNVVRLLESGARIDSRHLSVLQRQAAMLGGLVDDLLDVSRITRGLVELKREPVDLLQVARQALASVTQAAAAKQHRLLSSLPADPLIVIGDSIRLEQIILNLLTNAIKYSDRGSTVELMLEADAESTRLRVRDDGIGIAPDMLGHIFDLFGQAERGLDRAQGGLGIGLTIVRQLVELHDGTVEARSDGLGRGAEFVVTLPPPVAQADAGPAFAASVASDRSRCHLLVVDDNADIGDTLAELLEFVGYRVSVARDGPGALAVAAADLPDAVLLDIGLPGWDGYEVAIRLRALPGGDRLLLAALTGYGQPGDRERVAAAGFDRHFVKPVDITALERFLDETLGECGPEPARQAEAPTPGRTIAST